MSAPTPARRAAYEVVRRVFEHGAWADRSFRAAVSRHGLAGRERAQAQRLAYGAVQRRGTTDHLVAGLAGREPEKIDAPLLAALRLGLYELLFSGSADHASVDQAVELAKGADGRRRGAGLVNAVLRRAIREREALLDGLDDSDPAGAAIMHSHPLWIAELLWAEHGPETARSLMAAANEAPERAFRVNTLLADTATLARELEAAGVRARPPAGDDPLSPAEMLIVDGGEWSAIEEAVSAGRLIPQSRGSAAVVGLLGLEPGLRVLDLCAGPGIKTTQIAAAVGTGGEVVAVERDPARARELELFCRRAGASTVGVHTTDAAAPEPTGSFERVLADPPCSGLGTLASRPDSRWRRSPAEVETMSALQRRILDRGLAALAPGGTLVYSTCTISRAENEDVVGHPGAGDAVVDDLGAAAPQLASDSDSRCLQTRPDRDGTDGFFIARFRG